MLAVFGANTLPQPEQSSEPESSRKGYSLLIGFSILVFILIFLLTTPEQLTSRRVLLIDSELQFTSGNETPVLLKMDLSSSEQLKKLPTEFGGWTGSDYDVSSLEQALKADSLLMRSYSKPGLYQPIFFLVIQSELHSSFHPPIVCYPSLGWTIEETGEEGIPIANTAWAQKQPTEEWPSIIKNPEYGSYSRPIPAKRLVVFKGTEDAIKERRVVLYFYLKENKFVSDTVTMVRVSALAPLTGSYDEIVNIEKEFISDAFPHMFEIQEQEQEQGQMIIVHLAKSGVGGYLLLAFLFSIPLAILVYPRVRRLSAVAKENAGDNS